MKGTSAQIFKEDVVPLKQIKNKEERERQQSFNAASPEEMCLSTTPEAGPTLTCEPDIRL